MVAIVNKEATALSILHKVASLEMLLLF